jgi:hypothetical protein
VARKRFSNVIARIQRRTIERFNETDLVFVDHGCIEESDVEESWLRFSGAFDRS